MGGSSLESFALDVGIVIAVGLLTCFIMYVLCYCCPVELEEEQVHLTENDSNSEKECNVRSSKGQSPIKMAQHVQITVVPNPKTSQSSDVNPGTNDTNKCNRKNHYSLKKNIVIVPAIIGTLQQHSHANHDGAEQTHRFNSSIFNDNQIWQQPLEEIISHRSSQPISHNTVMTMNSSPSPLCVIAQEMEFSKPPYNPSFLRKENSTVQQRH